jgi:hypothetical protein
MAKTQKKVALHQLDSELGIVGLVASYANGEWEIHYADGQADDKVLEEAIKNHIAQPEPEPTVEEKLASVGLNLEDLKSALGL